LANFMPLLDWNSFDRRCWNDRIAVSAKGVEAFGCGDDGQALFWALRTDVRKDGTLDPDAAPMPVELTCPGPAGSYRVTRFDTREGRVLGEEQVDAADGELRVKLELRTDLALALKRL
jgi:hypothetical protein